MSFRGAFLFLCLVSALIPYAAWAEDSLSSAVIFAYHQIGEDGHPDTNIRLEQFMAHIEELRRGESYTVLPLPKITDSLKNGKMLPDKTIGISFDGGHKSVLEHAAPLLLKYEMPFTVFVAVDRADSDLPGYMNWRDLKKLARNPLVTIGLHPAIYTRLSDDEPAEIRRQINNARSRIREKLGHTPDLFAYPFGEFSAAYREVIANQGFSSAFGSQSATASSTSDIYALPRFTMTERYADLSRFRMVASALPLPVTDITPADPHLSTNHPVIGFTVRHIPPSRLSNLSCFVTGQSPPAIEHLGGGRIELRLHAPLDRERIRVNCTLPAEHQEGKEPRWRWFGMLLTLQENG